MAYPKKETVKGYRPQDGAIVSLRVNAASNALLVVDEALQRIQEGKAFTASFAADVGATTGTLDLLIVTPDSDVEAHLKYKVDVEAETHIALYEDVTATAGDAVVEYNRNRNSAAAAAVVVSSTPTAVTAGSTIVRQTHLVGGRVADSGDVIILKKNKKYLLRLSNITGAVNYMSANLDWVEHEPIV